MKTNNVPKNFNSKIKYIEKPSRCFNEITCRTRSEAESLRLLLSTYIEKQSQLATNSGNSRAWMSVSVRAQAHANSFWNTLIELNNRVFLCKKLRGQLSNQWTIKTQCKTRVHLGSTEPLLEKIANLHRKQKKIKKVKKSDVGKIILENTDFFQNAKFSFGLEICNFLFEKWGFFACHFFLAVLTVFFAFKGSKTRVYPPAELSYTDRLFG